MKTPLPTIRKIESREPNNLESFAIGCGHLDELIQKQLDSNWCLRESQIYQNSDDELNSSSVFSNRTSQLHQRIKISSPIPMTRQLNKEMELPILEVKRPSTPVKIQIMRSATPEIFIKTHR